MLSPLPSVNAVTPALCSRCHPCLQNGNLGDYEQRGIVPRTVGDLFAQLEKRPDRETKIHMSFLEIYRDTFTDLLAPDFEPGSTGA